MAGFFLEEQSRGEGYGMESVQREGSMAGKGRGEGVQRGGGIEGREYDGVTRRRYRGEEVLRGGGTE